MNRQAIEELAYLLGSEIARSTDKEVTIACPFAPYGGHRGVIDHNPNFGIKVNDEGKSVCNCFACRRGGLLSRVIQELVELDKKFQPALDFVNRQDRGIFIPSKPKGKVKIVDESLVKIMRAVRNNDISDTLKKRGVTAKEVKRFRLAYDLMHDRDVFPVYDHANQLRGVVGRRVEDDMAKKYHNYGEAVQLTEVFYGEQFLDLTHDTAILVEGPLDMIKVSRIYKNALALCGNMVMGEERITKLKKWFERVTLMLDADPAGNSGMYRLGLLLSKLFVVDVALLPDGMDPWDCSPRQIKTAYEGRKLWSLVDWKGGVPTEQKKRAPHSRQMLPHSRQ